MRPTATVLLALLALVTTQGLEIYQDYIPNGQAFPKHPSLGHAARLAKPSNHRLNQFGKDFQAQDHTWTKALCQADSDRDGRTNGEELGDPKCLWFRGDDDPQPSKGGLLTNPGVANDFSVEGFPETESDERDDYEAGEEEPTDDFDGGALPTWVVFHAVFMFLSIGLILPVAILFPYYLRHRRNWRDEHLKMMSVSNVLALVGFVLAVLAGGSGSFHGYFGWVVVFACFAQGVVGFLRRRIAVGYGREGWIKFHSRLGRSVAVMCTLQLLLGYVQMSDMSGGNWGLLIWGCIHFVLMCGVVFAVVLKTKMRTYEPAEAMGEEEDLGFAELPKVTTNPANATGSGGGD